MEDLISIIIPIYNAEKYLRRCIESVISQTYKNLEILLIDDGSKDGSASICDEYAGVDNRIKVIHKINGGVSSARNLGLDVATGNYIGFIDSDDYIAAEMYENLILQMKSESADISICGYYNENSKGDFQPYWKEQVKITFVQQEQISNLLSNKYYCCACWDKLFKKSLISDLRFDEKIKQYEDMWFLYQVMKRSNKASYTSEPYYYYCTNQGSASQVSFNDSMMSIIDVSENILKDIKENENKLLTCASVEFMRNNIMCAGNAARSDYKNKTSIKRIQNNIRKNIIKYMFSNASLGYKIYAILISINWNLFKRIVT